MKLALTLGLAALTLGSLLGCGPKTPQADGEPKPGAVKVGIVYDKGGLGDKSFNDSAHRGIEKAESELGVEVIAVESKVEKDYEANMRELADKGCSLVFAIGFNMVKACETVAKEFPGTKFAIVDGFVEQPNTRSLNFKEEQGSFLVGYLAGLMTKTGKIGFVGGQNNELIHKFEYGYYAGAVSARPDVQILPSKYTDDWDNIDVAKVSASFLYDGGADIVYHAAGRAGLGVIRAAKEKGRLAIGVDSDQDDIEPGSVLTSMIKRVDVSVFSTIKDLVDGKFTPGVVVYDLKSEGVGTSEFKNTKDAIGAENLAKLDEVRKKIVDGEIVVPLDKESFAAFKQALAAKAASPGKTEG
jgi:basic membrane protein A